MTKTTEVMSGVTRSSAGLRDAIFDEIDAIRNGTGNPTRANAVAKLAAGIVETLLAVVAAAQEGRAGALNASTGDHTLASPPPPAEGVGTLVELVREAIPRLKATDDGEDYDLAVKLAAALAAAEAASPVLLEGDLGGVSGADIAVQGTTALDPETPRSAGGEG